MCGELIVKPRGKRTTLANSMARASLASLVRWLSLCARAALAEGITLTFGWFARLLRLPVAPRPGDSRVSPLWMTWRLRKSGIIDKRTRVVSVEPSDLAGNRGLSGAMSRLTVKYNPPAPEAPTSFILKMSRPGFRNRATVIGGGQYREAMFYESDIAAELPSGMMPRCYYAHSSSFLGQYVMLLEECKDVTPVNFVFGNQIWGVPRPVAPPRDPVGVLTAMYQRAADMHAAYWRSPKLLRQVGWTVRIHCLPVVLVVYVVCLWRG